MEHCRNAIGLKASLSKLITTNDVEAFAALSMDNNPIHINEEYAKNTAFGKTIAHGAYVTSFISAVIANKLPGVGTIYLSQNSRFKKPVFIGDVVTATVELIESPKKGIFLLKTVCINQNGDVVVEGEATVMNRNFEVQSV